MLDRTLHILVTERKDGGMSAWVIRSVENVTDRRKPYGRKKQKETSRHFNVRRTQQQKEEERLDLKTQLNMNK